MIGPEGRPDAGGPLLDVSQLSLEFATHRGWVEVLDDVTFDLHRGEVLGLVGESGSGKTVTASALMGLVGAPHARISSGSIRFDGRELLGLPERDLRRIRGQEMGIVFQEARRSLNPAFTIGAQIADKLRLHAGMSRKEAWKRAVELLDMVEIAFPERRAGEYTHQLSGGMCQRAMIAMAIACEPKLLIADEPTTALDVTVQDQVLQLMKDLCRRLDIAILFITHDLGVVADMCDRVNVMYAGQIVETAQTGPLFASPRHPYAAGLLASIPDVRQTSARFAAIPGRVPSASEWPTGCRFYARCEHAVEGVCTDAVPQLIEVGSGHLSRCARVDDLQLPGIGNRYSGGGERTSIESKGDRRRAEPLLVVEGLSKSFVTGRDIIGRPSVRSDAVQDVSFSLGRGETIGIVGESGAGKSTVGRMVLRLIAPDSGSVRFDGVDVTTLRRSDLTEWRRHAQMVFQDPFTSLDPKMVVGASVEESLVLHTDLDRRGRQERVVELFDRVGLEPDHAARYPAQFSGGQLQRIAIARAIASSPQLVVCDEPVAALDMSVRAQVLNLLRDLQDERRISYVFISHDLSLVRAIAHSTVVMYRGRVVEAGPTVEIFERPRHPYTQSLLEAVPVPDPTFRRDRSPRGRRASAGGSGCAFYERCSVAGEACRHLAPELRDAGAQVSVACHLVTGEGVKGPIEAGDDTTARQPEGQAC